MEPRPLHHDRPPTQAGRGAGPAPLGLPRPSRLGIYTGAGASHSWLWLAQACEGLGLLDLAFLDQAAIIQGGLKGLDALAVSGGDAMAMARGLGPAGAAALEAFIARGGLYLGACAGAYLCLRSSKEPLKHFNFTAGRISNLARDLPRPLMLADKFSTPYGCAHVFHPVREAVLIDPAARGPWSGEGRLTAPLYGGPAMLADDPATVLATYAGFTPRTRFLAPRPLAEATLLGRAAALRVGLGQGWLYLLGPHLEHPGFPHGHRLLLKALAWDLPTQAPEGGRPDPPPSMTGPPARELAREIKRQLSNGRIVAAGLEDHPARWRVGDKVYEPAKLRVFLEAAWGRGLALERAGVLAVEPEAGWALAGRWAGVARGLRQLKGELDQGGDTLELFIGLLAELQGACAALMDIYFAGRRAGLAAPPRRRRLH